MLFFIAILRDPDKKAILLNYASKIKANGLLLGIVVLYFIWDFCNFLYAENKAYITGKYSFIVKMAFLACLLYAYIFYNNSEAKKSYTRMKQLMLNLGVVAIALSVTSTLFYYIDFLTVQNYNIAPTSDYNNYALTILIGLSVLVTFIINGNIDLGKKILYVSLSCMICIPPIYLSASRRSIYTMFGLIVLLFIIQTIKYIINKNREIHWKKILLGIAAFFMTCVLIYTQIFCFNYFNEHNDIEGLSSSDRIQEDLESMGGGNEEQPQGDSLQVERSFGQERVVIWKFALSKINEMDIKELLIGGGGSYSNDIYAHYDNSMTTAAENLANYFSDDARIRMLDPHNFLLNDFLEGGIIKIAILMAMILKICFIIFKALKDKYEMSMSLLLISIIVILSLMVSAHYGIMWGRWSIYIIVMAAALEGIIKWENISI